jgi:hypothetical protein
LNLLDLLLVRGLVLVRAALPHVLAPGDSNPIFHREGAKNAKKVHELAHCPFPSRSWRLRGERLNLLDLFRASAIVLVRIVRPQTTLIVD